MKQKFFALAPDETQIMVKIQLFIAYKISFLHFYLVSLIIIAQNNVRIIIDYANEGIDIKSSFLKHISSNIFHPQATTK